MVSALCICMLLNLHHWGYALWCPLSYFWRYWFLTRYVVNWSEILEGYKAFTVPSEEDKKSQRSTYAQLEAVADMKFTYVATCQNYGNQKRSGDRRATDILNLMVKYVVHLVKFSCNQLRWKFSSISFIYLRTWFWWLSTAIQLSE